MNTLENRQHNWPELQRKEEKASETKRWPEITQTSFKCFLKIRVCGPSFAVSSYQSHLLHLPPQKNPLKAPVSQLFIKARCVGQEAAGNEPWPLEMSCRREKSHVKYICPSETGALTLWEVAHVGGSVLFGMSIAGWVLSLAVIGWSSFVGKLSNCLRFSQLFHLEVKHRQNY